MIDNYMLFSNLPTLDLHGENRYSAIYYTSLFINDNYKLNNKLVKIVHGKGEGVLKKEIHKFLRTNNLVKVYKIDCFNEGVTIFELY